VRIRIWVRIRILVLGIRGSGPVSKRYESGTLGKNSEKTVWKDNEERQMGKKKRKTRGKEKEGNGKTQGKTIG
jgi:hypothetical protein